MLYSCQNDWCSRSREINIPKSVIISFWPKKKVIIKTKSYKGSIMPLPNRPRQRLPCIRPCLLNCCIDDSHPLLNYRQEAGNIFRVDLLMEESCCRTHPICRMGSEKMRKTCCLQTEEKTDILTWDCGKAYFCRFELHNMGSDKPREDPDAFWITSPWGYCDQNFRR